MQGYQTLCANTNIVCNMCSQEDEPQPPVARGAWPDAQIKYLATVDLQTLARDLHVEHSSIAGDQTKISRDVKIKDIPLVDLKSACAQ